MREGFLLIWFSFHQKILWMPFEGRGIEGLGERGYLRLNGRQLAIKITGRRSDLLWTESSSSKMIRIHWREDWYACWDLICGWNVIKWKILTCLINIFHFLNHTIILKCESKPSYLKGCLKFAHEALNDACMQPAMMAAIHDLRSISPSSRSVACLLWYSE